MLAFEIRFICDLLSFRSEVSFGVDSRHNMGKQAHIHVVNKNLYGQGGNRTPVPYGVLDKRMVINKTSFYY